MLTAALVRVRGQIGEAHVALAYVLVVLGASARGGRRVGLGVSVACFLAFNYFFLPPYSTLAVHNPLDWGVLAAFLLTGAVAAQLLYRAQREAQDARRRADEIDHLAAMGAEALQAPRAEDAVVSIARVIRSALSVDLCEIYLRDEATVGLRLVARSTPREDGAESPEPADGATLGDGHPHPAVGHAPDLPESPDRARERGDGMGSGDAGGAHPPHPSTEIAVSTPDLLRDSHAAGRLMPLRVKDEPLGVLRLETAGGMRLDARQERFAEALAYYAALALERVRLAAAAQHAAAFREADRLKDALLASVSHDLRTPLTTIKALAHELAEGGDERAQVVEAEADRLNRFVADLLDLARLNAGALPLRLEPAAAEDVLGAALQQVEAVWPGRRVDASVQPGHLLVGRFDFVHTLHALANLLENALKYSPADAAVRVEVAAEGERLRFDVTDRGPGVPAAERELIFEPFYRGDGTAGPGSGVGLGLARRLAQAQGGDVRYAPAPGGGSRFTLWVPAVDPAELARLSL